MEKNTLFALSLTVASLFFGCTCFGKQECPANPAAKRSNVPRMVIHLAGDSTCASYPVSRAPLTGWGQVLSTYCKEDVKVINRAVSGASSRSFIAKKHWDKLLRAVHKGDWVIIQFGHNDHSRSHDRFADAAVAFPANLRKFIADVRAKGACPIIATSIVKCIYKNGRIAPDYLADYRNAAIAVAQAEKVPVIDLNKITRDRFNALGEKEAFKFYLGLKPAPAPVKGNAVKAAAGRKSSKPRAPQIDRIHLNRQGALEVAKWFVEDCKAQKLPIMECFK